MKKSCLIALFSLISLMLFAGAADTLHVLTAPQFAGAYYASFARNYLGSEAAGRGYTGAGMIGSGEMGLINPAVMRPDSVRVFIELDAKPSIEAPELDYFARYKSENPLGMAGITMPLPLQSYLTLCYSNPQSIVLRDYTIQINQGGEIINRQPSYNMHRLSLMANKQLGSSFSLGLSLHNQWHQIRDSIFRYDFHRDSHDEYVLRIQPGFLYHKNDLGIGLSATLPAQIEWKMRHVEYTQQLPLELKGGASKLFGDNLLALDIGYRNFEAENEAFNDELTLGLGFEKHVHNRIYRLGYMYKSGVWDGTIIFPIHSNLDEVGDIWEWRESITIHPDAQHHLSAGIEYLFKDGSVNASILQAAFGEVFTTHLQLGINVRLSVFTRKREVRS